MEEYDRKNIWSDRIYPSLGYLPIGDNSASLVTAQWADHLGTDIPVRTATYDRYY
jgi:hypothetical protein